jgi:tetratricopeptide (TPR) repeat protein
MQKPSILGLAAAAGILAFCWTLYQGASKVELRRPHSYTYTDRGPTPTTMRAAGRISTAASTIPELQRHLQNNPDDYRAWRRLAERLSWNGRPGEAADAYRSVIRRTDSFRPTDAEYGRALFDRAMAYRALGEDEMVQVELSTYLEWLAAMGYSVATIENRNYLHRLGWAARLTGDEETAQLAWSRGIEVTIPAAETSPGIMYMLAAFQALVGQHDQAIASLQKAAAAEYADPLQAQHDEDFAALRDDPAFAEIIAAMRENVRKIRPRMFH